MDNKKYICCTCRRSFPLKEVSVWKQTHFPEILQAMCRECVRNKQRKYRKKKTGRKAANEASGRAYIKHNEKWRARAKARCAVKTGLIKKPKKCEVCEKVKPLQGHHPDYSKPLGVIWLCARCHANTHSAK